jgi:hypothetical protein
VSKRNPNKIQKSHTQPVTAIGEPTSALADNSSQKKTAFLNLKDATETVSSFGISKPTRRYYGQVATNTDDNIPSQKTSTASDEKQQDIPKGSVTSSEDEEVEDKNKSISATMTWAALAYDLTSEKRIGLPPLFIVIVFLTLGMICYTFIQDNSNHVFDMPNGVYHFFGKILCLSTLISVPSWLIILFNKRLSRKQKTILSIIFLIFIITFGIFGLLLLVRNNISKTEHSQSTEPATTNNTQSVPSTPTTSITTANNQPTTTKNSRSAQSTTSDLRDKNKSEIQSL